MLDFLFGKPEDHDHAHDHEFVAPEWTAPEQPTFAPWGNGARQSEIEEDPVCLAEEAPEPQVCEALGEEAAEAGLSEEELGKLTEAEALLTSGFLDPITDGNACDAVTLLEGMSPEAQGMALEKMGDAQFAALLDELPTEDKGRFEALYQNIQDPERRLRMWAEFQKADAENQADANEEDVDFWDAINPFSDSDEEYRNGQRDKIADNTATEVDEEVAFLLDRMKKGETVTAADVDELALRKGKELEMEMQYGFLLTNSLGWDAEGNRPELERRTWSLAELQNVEDGMSRLPSEHVTYNRGLTEIQRVQTKMVEQSDGTWKNKTNVGGDAANGRIRIFDLGADTTADTWRTDRDSQLAGHDTDQLSLLEEVITHEIGHIYEESSGLEEKWRDASSWKDWSNDTLRQQLANDGMAQADIDQFMTDIESGDRQHNGNTYRKNHYGGYVSHDQGAVPVSDPGGDTEWSMDDSREWSYAGETQGEHFAETYAKATHAPEALHEDLISQPQANIVSATAVRDGARANVDALIAAGAPQAAIDSANASLKKAEDQLVDATDIASDRQKQWNIMRQDVFGLTDTKVTEASTALSGVASGKTGGDALVAEFEAASERCATPWQLDALKKQYMDRINALP